MPKLNYQTGFYNGATRNFKPVRQRRRLTEPARCPVCKSHNNVRYLPDRRYGWYCLRCNLEFDTKTGEVYRPTISGGVRLVLINSETLEVVETKTVRVKIVDKEKSEKLVSIVKMGVYKNFIVFEFADGKQKMYNAALVESVEEL